MDELPERAVVVGAGYIALEFAGILHGMGVETHVMYRADKPLRGYARSFPQVLNPNARSARVRSGVRPRALLTS